MTEMERTQEVICELAAAVSKAVVEIADMFRTIVKRLSESCNIVFLEAYVIASQERPAWVHKANYSKKKRTRKKYHDRIVRTYGRR
jgi:hypothetical protein